MLTEVYIEYRWGLGRLHKYDVDLHNKVLHFDQYSEGTILDYRNVTKIRFVVFWILLGIVGRTNVGWEVRERYVLRVKERYEVGLMGGKPKSLLSTKTILTLEKYTYGNRF